MGLVTSFEKVCGGLCPLLRRLCRKRVTLMVTYEGLFAFCLVIIGVISLLQNKKK